MTNKLNKEEYLGSQNKTFCMAPWIHMHYMPTGEVLPCCVWPYDEPLGDVTHDSIYEIWNNSKYKSIRKQMLSGQLPKGCLNCKEKDNAGAHSMRKHMNFKFTHLFDEMMEKTLEDGTLTDFKMAYFDVRFSNICNFKCRGCSPALSSSWLSDHEKLYDYKSKKSKYIQIFPNSKFENELRELLPFVEEVYFAGGEPLIMREHYIILDELIKMGKTDIRLVYNTNMSILKFKNKNILNYWSQFKNLFVSVSIDDFEERGEYFRKGMSWAETIENIKTVKQLCPHALITVNCTVNIMNILNLFNLHSKLVELNIIEPENSIINLMLDPEEYSIQVLPPSLKKKVEEKFRRFLFVCEQKYPGKFEVLKNNFLPVIQFMNAKDNSHLFGKFISRTEKLDEIRGENFRAVFKEFSDY